MLAYRVKLAPDFSTQRLSGSESITLRTTGPLAEFVFSPNALLIERATINGLPARVTADKQGIVFQPAQPLRAHETATLSFAFSGTPARGTIFGADWVYTSYWGCDWMVCLQDSPGDKARMSLDVRLPRGMISQAAGRLQGTVAARNDMIHRWRTTRAYSPYLFAFAAGRLTRVSEVSDGNRLTYLSIGSVDETKLRELFKPASAMVRFFSEKAGIALPDRRYAQLIVPGSEAQEAVSHSLLGQDELTPLLTDPQADWAIAHELAHQWWGNLVTCREWSEFWLNEGITVFMTAAWKEQAHGRAAYDAEMALARARLARARDAGWDKPLAFAGTYPSLGLRRAVQYSKGALFMDHLRSTLGDRAFWRGLKAYTRAHVGGSVTSRDFQSAMERASGRDLSVEFNAWVFG